MTITDKFAKQILQTYKEAWIEQDVVKILSIFHKNGIYHEYVLKKPYVGHKAIATYWKRKVVKEQSKITFKLLNYYICNNTLIAEWDASFNSNIENAKIRIKEVAILEIGDNKIQSLREYWQSESKSLR
jgi:hypothetical protein